MTKTYNRKITLEITLEITFHGSGRVLAKNGGIGLK